MAQNGSILCIMWLRYRATLLQGVCHTWIWCVQVSAMMAVAGAGRVCVSALYPSQYYAPLNQCCL